MNFRGISIFFVIISVFVITGHAMIPHSHDCTYKVAFIRQDHHSLLEKIKEILSVNIGVEHLDEYKNTDSINVNNENSILYLLPIGYFNNNTGYKENEVVFSPYLYPFISSQTTQNVSGLRAPPFMN